MPSLPIQRSVQHEGNSTNSSTGSSQVKGGKLDLANCVWADHWWWICVRTACLEIPLLVLGLLASC